MKFSRHASGTVVIVCLAAVSTSVSAKDSLTSRGSVQISVTIPPRIDVVAAERAPAVVPRGHGSVLRPFCLAGNSKEATYSLTLLPGGQTTANSLPSDRVNAIPVAFELHGVTSDGVRVVSSKRAEGLRPGNLGSCGDGTEGASTLTMRTRTSAKLPTTVTEVVTLLIAPD